MQGRQLNLLVRHFTVCAFLLNLLGELLTAAAARLAAALRIMRRNTVQNGHDHPPIQHENMVSVVGGELAASSTSTIKHESVRRRLFQSHIEAQPSLPSSTFPSPSNELFSSNIYHGNTGGLKLSQKVLIAFACVGVFFLLGVHLYLFQVLHNQHDQIMTRHLVPGKDDELDGNGNGKDNIIDADASNNRPNIRGGPPWSSTAALEAVRLPERQLLPLRPLDYEKYTIRINTWRRNDQLLASVAHHSSCPGVEQIQVVWCDHENEPPVEELAKYPNVMVERHEANTLNERFNILQSSTPTLGILSIDDDVLRPCEAIDAGFFKWTKSPHRMVGFDARTHVENKNGSWEYGYLSTTEKTNRYSFSLTRYCFVHRDYLNQYMNDMPKSILNSVANNFNCEDVAMSFLISARTNGQPSLLADLWAMKSLIKLYVPESISGTDQHKALRDECIESFATTLGLKGGDDNQSQKLKMADYVHHKDFFACGADEDDKADNSRPKSQRQIEFDDRIQAWRSMDNSKVQKEVKKLMAQTGYVAYRRGLIVNTDRWKEKFQLK